MNTLRTNKFKNLVKEKLPWVVPARRKLSMIRTYGKYYALILLYRLRYPRESVFCTIYKKHAWGGGESLSGGGSNLIQASAIMEAIPTLLRKIGARSVLDAPCGDFYWMSRLSLDVDSYIGMDIVPELIRENQRKYETGTFHFIHADITRDELPRVDLIICRDCMVHFSYEDIFRCLCNFKKSGSTYLLATTYPGLLKRNWNIVTGMWRPLDLQLPPFNFPGPIKLIEEECAEATDYKEKSLALWRIENLPI